MIAASPEPDGNCGRQQIERQPHPIDALPSFWSGPSDWLVLLAARCTQAHRGRSWRLAVWAVSQSTTAKRAAGTAKLGRRETYDKHRRIKDVTVGDRARHTSGARYSDERVAEAQSTAEAAVADVRARQRRREEFDGKKPMLEFFRNHLAHSTMSRQVFAFFDHPAHQSPVRRCRIQSEPRSQGCRWGDRS
jgi:hypothetical protein